MRKAYHEALTGVQNEMIKMAGLVGKAISDSMDALGKRDIKASEAIVRRDAEINRLRFDIEDKCIMLLATQQPMAVDLRIIAAVINIITDLERIGDHAEGIAKISIAIGDNDMAKPLVDLPKMAEQGRSMLDRAMKAFMDRDVAASKVICDEDDIVDALYDKCYGDLIQLMIADPSKVTDATYMIWAAHNLERIADRVTNIAERVVYMVTGKMHEMNVSKY